MANLNRIILIGKVAHAPEVRSTLDGIPMAQFKLKVDRPQGGSDLMDVIAWRRLAEICGEYLKEGQLTLIEGRIQIRSFEDQTGVRRWVTEIVANNMQMLEKSQLTSRVDVGLKARDSKPVTNEEFIDESELENDLPF